MTAREEKIRVLLAMGLPRDEILRMERAVELKMAEERSVERSVKEALRQFDARRATFKDDVKVPARKSKQKSKARKSKQKELRAVDHVFSFMHNIGMNLSGEKTKEQQHLTPFDDVMQGRWQ